MFDNVTLKIYGLPNDYIPCERVEVKYRTDVNTFKGNMENMGIYKSPNCLIIRGSLAKYLKGENITPLNRGEVKQAIKKLEQDIGLDLKGAIVSSVEFGTSVTIKQKPSRYLYLFGYSKKLTKVEYSKWKRIETVNNTSRTGSFEFTVYDKIREMSAKKQEIPSFYAGVNVLRLEYKIRKRRGIKAKFKRDLTAYNLFDKNIYKRFQELFLETYRGIYKMGRLVYADKSIEITPSLLTKLLAEQFRQSFPKDYRFFIQQLEEAGKLTKGQLDKIQAENYKSGNNLYISEQSPLIKELDAHIEIMMLGT